MEKINLHTHSTFCDGKNTPREMVLGAIEKGFTALGFSGHSMYPFADEWHICPKELDKYVAEIRTLQKEFSGQIKIYCGFEADFLPPLTLPSKKHYSHFNPDFLIGAVHYLVNENGQFTVDDSKENVAEGFARLYKNNGKELVHEYFLAQRKMLEKGDFDIIAHPDLIRKRNGLLKMFDENESFYKEEVQLTAKAIAKAGVVAEINTGAIARGDMDDVYPSAYFLDLLYQNKVPICISSDAHTTRGLDCAFDKARAIALKSGYKELVYPHNGSQDIVKL